MPTRYDQIEAQRLQLEPRYERLLRRVLIRQGEQAATAFENGATAELAAAMVKQEELVTVLSKLYSEVGMLFAKQDYDELTEEYQKSLGVAYERKAKAPAEIVTGWLGRLKSFILREGATRIRGMMETTRQVVRETLNESVQQGQGIPDAARSLRKQVGLLSKARATLIARTELVSAANVGSLIGAQSTGLKLNKLWIATPGARTRDTHAAANGQLAPMDGFFTVGGYPARYPGDVTLPVGEVVNCRCAIGYKPL